MDPSESSQSGLPPHIIQQLHQASQQIAQSAQSNRLLQHKAPRGGHRGRGNRGPHRGSNFNHTPVHHPQYPTMSSQSQDYESPHPQYQPILQGNSTTYASHPHTSVSANRLNHQQNMTTSQAGSEEDFPALGSTRSSNSSYTPSLAPSQSTGTHSRTHERAQDFQRRARAGFYRGGNAFPHQTFSQGRQEQASLGTQSQYHVQQHQAGEFRRPTAHHQTIYNPAAASIANQQHVLRKKYAVQCTYLELVAAIALQNQMPIEEQQEKEAMRQTLENIMHNVIREYGMTQPTIDPAKVKLKCYGSLANGFAVAGSDLDLLVTFPRDDKPIGNIEEDIKRLLEKALLDAGFGARLLTQTRVPILRVCESPTPEILDGLRRHRRKWEEEEQASADFKTGELDPNRLPEVIPKDMTAVMEGFEELGNTPAEKPLPPSPGRELPHLEYTKECGIQCDVNFSNYVALHNSLLLRTYCLHDERVRRMGVIIKTWAKTRKINTPYHGTLSSYGYILMLLHFLMNVVSPPVIPNLQVLAKDRDAWNNKTDIETVDGFDVRFLSETEQIKAAIEGRPSSKETIGALLRGFFWYYSDHQGFHWTNDIISIRTVGGVLTKRSKGWTEAKWTGARNTIRNRYLLCIEDPFETDHNIARTVCHSGIVAIRDEFRRARKILERIENLRGIGWQWIDDNNLPGEDFMAFAEERGDLLRKDQEFHKLKRLRAEAEATEKALNEANALRNLQEHSDGNSKQDGTSSQHNSTIKRLSSDVPAEVKVSSAKLTQSIGQQTDTCPTKRGRVRQLRPESDDELDESDVAVVHDVNMSHRDVHDDIGSRASECISSNGSENHHELEPHISDGLTCCPRTMDNYGNLLPWDLDTQEGRWLQWRDRKVRTGVFLGVSRPGLKRLNEKCPFDPARPASIFNSQSDRVFATKPPFPMSTLPNEEASSSSIDDTVPAMEDTVPLDSPSGQPIGWDLSISDGRWLSKRDHWIKIGNFTEPSTAHLFNLHKEFPYLENTPLDEQQRRNDVLRQRHVRWLRGETSQLMKDIPQLESFHECDSSVAEDLNRISWDMSLSDGRWLNKRDGQVRHGIFRRIYHTDKALKLHDEFPYIVNTPAAVQKQRNLELKLRDIKRQMAEIPEYLHEMLDKETAERSERIKIIPAEEALTRDEIVCATSAPVDPADAEPLTVDEANDNVDEYEWDTSKRTGKWLKKRDTAMRSGTWATGKLYSWQRRINKIFPFISKPTSSQQAEWNRTLRGLDINGYPISSLSQRDDVGKRCTRTSEKDSIISCEESEMQLISLSDDEADAEIQIDTDCFWMKVGWDRSSRAGRWLSWRDKQIRNGTFKGIEAYKYFHKVDRMFPYLANPSTEEQGHRNTLLRNMANEGRIFRRQEPRPKKEKVENLQGSSSPMQAILIDSQNEGEKQVHDDEKSHDLKEILPVSTQIQWDETLLGSWLSWRDRKIRQRNWKPSANKPFFHWMDDTFPFIANPTPQQQQQYLNRLKTIINSHPRLNDYEALDRQTRPSITEMEEFLSLTSQRRAGRPPDAETGTSKETPAVGHNKTDDQGDFTRNQRLAYFNSLPSTSQDYRDENKTTLVIQPDPTKSECSEKERTSANASSTTCDPPTAISQTMSHGPISERPREEDPNIMPIPSAPNFVFDERQLRDLRVIQGGGNGCARFGKEWEIEEDAELGGGGWMGQKSSTTTQETTNAQISKTWDGKGDEEGLLEELPGL